MFNLVDTVKAVLAFIALRIQGMARQCNVVAQHNLARCVGMERVLPELRARNVEFTKLLRGHELAMIATTSKFISGLVVPENARTAAFAALNDMREEICKLRDQTSLDAEIDGIVATVPVTGDPQLMRMHTAMMKVVARDHIGNLTTFSVGLTELADLLINTVNDIDDTKALDATVIEDTRTVIRDGLGNWPEVYNAPELDLDDVANDGNAVVTEKRLNAVKAIMADHGLSPEKAVFIAGAAGVLAGGPSPILEMFAKAMLALDMDVAKVRSAAFSPTPATDLGQCMFLAMLPPHVWNGVPERFPYWGDSEEDEYGNVVRRKAKAVAELASVDEVLGSVDAEITAVKLSFETAKSDGDIAKMNETADDLQRLSTYRKDKVAEKTEIEEVVKAIDAELNAITAATPVAIKGVDDAE